MQGNPERVFIALTTLLFNPWIAGVILSAILAAVMSTLSAQLLLCSSAITEDFYKGFSAPTPRNLNWCGLGAAWCWRWRAFPSSSPPTPKTACWAWLPTLGRVFGAAFGPLVILSLTWRRLTQTGALASMITGAVVVVLWAEVVNPLLKRAELPTMYEIVPGFILATLAAWLVSLNDKAPEETVFGTL